MKLRAYQRKAVSALSGMLDKHGRVVAVSPTGSGKTVIGASLVMKRRDRVLWLAHRVELLRQARRQLLKAGVRERDVGIVSGVDRENEGARVLVASVDAMRARDEIGDVGLIVVDEAHRVAARGYQKVLAAVSGAQVLGLTATPWRLDGKGLGETFSAMHVCAYQAQLIADGFLAPPVTYGVPLEKAREMVAGVGATSGDYAVGALGKAMMRGTLMGDVVAECHRLAKRESTIVFAATREHGQALTARFVAAGRRVEYLDGQTLPAERDAIIARLASGKTQIVVNVDVLTEGFDCPAVKCIAIARPTRSRTRWLQYCGRAARPHLDKRAIILDHGGNVWRHGLPERDHEWSLAGSERESGDAPVKRCAECGAMIHAAAIRCSECGAEQPLTERESRELQERETELERLRATEDFVAQLRKFGASEDAIRRYMSTEAA